MTGPALAEVSVVVNGVSRVQLIDPRMSLLDLLRERLGLTGAKKGCDHGQCGACTVLIYGRRGFGTAAAIGSAVWHATGRRVRDLPITPAKLLE